MCRPLRGQACSHMVYVLNKNCAGIQDPCGSGLAREEADKGAESLELPPTKVDPHNP
ncbi:hypothetical protein PMI29_04500 [Pseudomonas sp. GM49]|nr:hypothetical protein PMI29_04500 [Pseudomonas sp. GM49]